MDFFAVGPAGGRDWIIFAAGVVTGFLFRGSAKYRSGGKDFWIPKIKPSHDPARNSSHAASPGKEPQAGLDLF